jgi:hypothetical protein
MPYTDDLFTPEEHRVLAAWFDVHPPAPARRLSLRSALDAIHARCSGEGPRGDRADAAVAHILQGAPDRWLPGWEATFGSPCAAEARPTPTESPGRHQALRPRHLLTASWPGRHVGRPSSISYYLTWVPGYDRYVVSRAVSGTAATGDAALGHFGTDVPRLEGLRDILVAGWAQLAHEGAGRWSSIRSTGQLTFQLIEAWADLIWPTATGEYGTRDRKPLFDRPERSPATRRLRFSQVGPPVAQ